MGGRGLSLESWVSGSGSCGVRLPAPRRVSPFRSRPLSGRAASSPAQSRSGLRSIRSSRLTLHVGKRGPQTPGYFLPHSRPPCSERRHRSSAPTRPRRPGTWTTQTGQGLGPWVSGPLGPNRGLHPTLSLTRFLWAVPLQLMLTVAAAQGTFHRRRDRAPGLRPRAASRPQQHPSPMPWPLWLCPAWPASPSVLFLGMGTQVRSPGCSRGPCTGTGSLRSLAGLTPAAEQPRAAATPGASDGEREGILLSGGGEIRAGALPREPRVTRGPSLSLEKPPTSQARPLPSVGRGCRCARGKWRRRAGRS